MWIGQCACGEFYGVRSWQNSTRCRDDVKVLWCHSHLVWLHFKGFIPYMCLFLSRTLFCDLFLLLFYGKREVRWEGRPRGRCMVCKVCPGGMHISHHPLYVLSWPYLLQSSCVSSYLRIDIIVSSLNTCSVKLLGAYLLWMMLQCVLQYI